MIPFSFSLNSLPTWREFAELMLETDRATFAVMAMLTALVIYNVRNYLANPTLCTIISPMMVVLSMATYQFMILAEITVPGNFNNWLVSTVIATSAGAAIGILIVAIAGQLVELFARMRARKEMPEFVDPGSSRERTAAQAQGAGQ